jgi:hypothetical protein
MNKEEYIVKIKDLKEILDYAKYLFPITKMPINISNQTLGPEEINRVLLMEAILVYLNKNELLNKVVKIDYK